MIETGAKASSGAMFDQRLLLGPIALLLATSMACDKAKDKPAEEADKPAAEANDKDRDEDEDDSEDEDEDDGEPASGTRKISEKELRALDDEASSLAPEVENKGTFVFKHLPAKQEQFKAYDPLFDHGRLPSLVEVMSIVRLPRSIPVVTLECGEPNAFYTNKKHAVVLCFDLAHDFYTKFRARGADDQTASDQTLNALTFVLLHEMGHAIVGELELGVTGGEEDAVDDLAALLLVDAKQPKWAVDGALSMAMLDASGKPPYFDEHSIGEQRFYNITCIVYGSAPDQYRVLVEKQVLPERRAVRCEKEYTQKNKAWENLLRPHIRGK